MRINITGNAASGKTTLAAHLGARFGLPVISLDSIVWQPHWIKTPTDQRLSAEQRLVASPAWIIDGVSDLVRANADLVVFLDVPWPLCAFRGVTRALRYRGRTRPGLPHPCPDIAIVPRLLKLIYRFPANAGARIRADATREPHRYRTERYPIQIETVVEHVRALSRRAMDR
jgi:adenylate kinase family enzyme